jgi:hypothetical protein
MFNIASVTGGQVTDKAALSSLINVKYRLCDGSRILRLIPSILGLLPIPQIKPINSSKAPMHLHLHVIS